MNYGTIVAELRLFETLCRHSSGKGEIALLAKNAADAIENLDDICQHQADEIMELKKRLQQEDGKQ